MNKKRLTWKRKTKVLIALTLSTAPGVFSCRHGDRVSGPQSSDSEKSSIEIIESLNLTHPQAANEFATRIFVSTTVQQPEEKISECIEQIAAIGKDSANQDDMVKAIATSQPIFAQNFPLYHTCFYQIAARLDNRLTQGGSLVSELSSEFFETTQAMWIMAKALDQVSGKNVYYSYLKKRYVQISRDVFGRHVTPLGDGFDEKKKPGGNIKQTREKAAGRSKQ